MKAFGKLLTIVLLVSFLAACGSSAPEAAPEAAPEVAPEAAPEPEMTAAEQWAMENGVGPYTPARRLGGDRSCSN
jgi:predicted small lipoprotein YifL